MQQITLADVIGGLKKELAQMLREGKSRNISHSLLLPGKGHRLNFVVEENKSVAGRMILSVTVTPPDKSHITTRYLCRGSLGEIADYMEKTPETAWAELTEELVRGCSSFYYP